MGKGGLFPLSCCFQIDSIFGWQVCSDSRDHAVYLDGSPELFWRVHVVFVR